MENEPQKEQEHCCHDRAIPIAIVVADENDGWVHWCPDCGALSDSGSDPAQPKSPWILPGELADDVITRIQRIAVLNET